MTTFEDKLQASAQRLTTQDNKHMHVPQNPLRQKRTYWGWVATPAAAVIGLIFGMSLDLLSTDEPVIQYAQVTDTIHVDRPVHDTLYLTQIIEKEKVIVRQAANTIQPEPAAIRHEEEATTCTSVLCDGINYSVLATN